MRAIALGDRDADALHAYDGRRVAASSPPATQGDDAGPRASSCAGCATAAACSSPSVPGGMLAALTTRYTVRDLAAELGLPVMLAAPPTPDATNLVRLSVAAARAARPDRRRP